MKQNITRDQLHELTDKQKKKLLEYMKNKDYLPHGTQMMVHDSGHYLAEFINIGQMIEFLDKHIGDDWSIHFGNGLAFICQASKDGFYGKTAENRDNELCDGLWEAVKKVL
jgi:hypothetical protein